MKGLIAFVVLLCGAIGGVAWYGHYKEARGLKAMEAVSKSVEAQTAVYKAANDAYEHDRELAQQAIKAHKVRIGMTEEEAIRSWGKPEKRNRTVTSDHVHEQWVYGEQFLYFRDGVLESFQDNR